VSARDLLEAELVAARAAVAVIDAARADAADLAAMRAELVAAKRRILEAPIVAKAIEEHGAIELVETVLGVVVVKRPHAATFRRFADKGSTKSADVEELIRKCVVYPDAAGLDVLLAEQPGALTRIADAVVILGGAAAAERSGK